MSSIPRVVIRRMGSPEAPARAAGGGRDCSRSARRVAARPLAPGSRKIPAEIRPMAENAENDPNDPGYAHFRLEDLEARRRAGDDPWLEVLRVPSLRAGLYVLAAGAVDDQQPHEEDEIYVVLAGRARFVCEGEDRPVESGDVIYVAKRLDHRFHSIEEELRVAV